MPIRDSERHRYPTDWPDISQAIRARSGGRCECDSRCGHDHTADPDPERTYPDTAPRPKRCRAQQYTAHPITGSRVVLTVAHLDHTPEHCDPSNLLAMCQRCHLRYDRDHHAANAAATRHARQQDAGQLTLDLDAA